MEITKKEKVLSTLVDFVDKEEHFSFKELDIIVQEVTPESKNNIIFSIPVYKDYSQGIKRIHRLGQKETVIYYHFYQSNFLDYGMKKALDEKIDYNINMFQSDLKNNDNLLNKT